MSVVGDLPHRCCGLCGGRAAAAHRELLEAHARVCPALKDGGCARVFAGPDGVRL